MEPTSSPTPENQPPYTSNSGSYNPNSGPYNSNPNSYNPGPSTQSDGKVAAIISYFGLIGLIIAFVLNSSQKAPLATYHIRQSIGLLIVLVLVYIVAFVLAFIPGIRVIAGFLFPVVGIIGLIFIILGVIAAANGEQKPLPIIGAEIQNRLASIG